MTGDVSNNETYRACSGPFRKRLMRRKVVKRENGLSLRTALTSESYNIQFKFIFLKFRDQQHDILSVRVLRTPA